MEYNTSRGKLLMPEYGRNIQKMVDFILTIEDREQRQKNANAIIEMMGVLNPHLKNVEDFRHKLWDHIFRISDFNIDIDSPYPIPSREELQKKPEPLSYPQRNRGNRHIGRNITQVIEKAVKDSDETKRKGYANSVAYYMKLAYANWHKENVQDEMIKDELNLLSKGVLEYVPGDTRTPRLNNGFKKHAQSNQNRNKNNNNNSNSNNNNNNNNRNGQRNNNNNFHNRNAKPNNNRSFGQKNG